jgi:hypothetical protein
MLPLLFHPMNGVAPATITIILFYAVALIQLPEIPSFLKMFAL